MAEQLTNALGSVYLKLEFDEKTKCAIVSWRGFIRLPEIKQGFDTIIDFMDKNQCHALFSDHSGIVGPWNEGNEWLFGDWQPRAIKKGLRYWAINTGDDLFSNISLELFLTKEEDRDYVVKVFEDNKSSKDWLEKILIADPLDIKKELAGKSKATLPPKKEEVKKGKEEKPKAAPTASKPAAAKPNTTAATPKK